MTSPAGKWTIMGSSICIATGLSLSGFFISETIYKSKIAVNTAEVKGLAERRVFADTAHWSISTEVKGTGAAQLPEMYRKLKQDQTLILDLLKKHGFTEVELKIGVVNHQRKEYRNKDQSLVEEEHTLTGRIGVETRQVYRVDKVRAELNGLMADGLKLTNNPPRYHYTTLNEIKPDMVKEATRNARLAANEFAENAGVKVGGIRSARQGGFVIRDVGSSYRDDSRIEKTVRVVTHVTFLLTE